MKNLVLFVDDDKLPMKYYVEALKRSGLKVKYCLDVDNALEFIKEKDYQIRAVVLDIMMPPGKAYMHEDTKCGLRTGVFLLKDIRKSYPNTPIVVLTNVRNPKTLEEFEESDLLKIAFKPNFPPFALVDLIKELIG